MNAFRIALAALLLFAAAVAQASRLAEVRIYDRAMQRELPAHWQEGRAYVVGHPGNEYEIVIRNRTGEDLLAVVSVDGVNVLSGETAHPRQRGYLVGAWDSVRITGWRKSLAETAAFYFTSIPDSYAARTDRPDNVGVIGVALFQRRDPPIVQPAQVEAPARLESRARSGVATPRAPGADVAQEAPASPAPSLGTGHGRRESSAVEMVPFERRTRMPAQTIAIHYDSRENLVARGVLPNPHARRHPTPFPGGFVPDP